MAWPGKANFFGFACRTPRLLGRDVPNFFQELEAALARGEKSETLLSNIVAHFAGQAGTIHRLDAATGLLRLATQTGLPAPVLEKINTVPIGKGMAGLAAARREPVQVCNLQTDDSGVARPGARATGMEGSIAVPMLAGGACHGVLGVAKSSAHEWSAAEAAELLEIAARLV